MRRSQGPLVATPVILSLFLGTMGAPTNAVGPDHRLIVLTVEREGVAGMTGLEWTIWADGHWTGEYLRPGKSGVQRERLAEGTLQAQQLRTVSEAIGHADFASLPSCMGEAPPVNAQRHSLEVNGKRVTLLGVSSRGRRDLAKQIKRQYGNGREMGQEVRRFLDLMQAVETAVSGDR